MNQEVPTASPEHRHNDTGHHAHNPHKMEHPGCSKSCLSLFPSVVWNQQGHRWTRLDELHPAALPKVETNAQISSFQCISAENLQFLTFSKIASSRALLGHKPHSQNYSLTGNLLYESYEEGK